MSDKRPGRLPSIGTRLLLGHLLLIVLMTAVVFLILQRQAVMQRSFTLLDGIHRTDQLLLECRRQEKNFLLRGGQASADLLEDSLKELIEGTGRLRAVTNDPDFSPLLEQLHGKEVEYGEAFGEMAARVFAGGSAGGEGTVDSKVVRSARECHALIDHMRGLATDRFISANVLSRRIGFGSIAAGLILAISLSVILTRRIVRPLVILRDVTRTASLGDLQDMGVEMEDLRMDRFDTRETWDLAAGLRRMITSLRLLVPTERGLMDDYHMTILLLVNRAAGPGGPALIERTRVAAGLDNFSEVGPATMDVFLEALERESTGFLPPDTTAILIDAIRALGR